MLNLFYKYNRKILSNDLAEKIMGEIIRYGLYRPTRGHTPGIIKKWGAKRISEKSPVGVELLSDEEVVRLLQRNPQKHKEAGFRKGWPSRFATVFDIAKELGFVYYRPGELIEFSETGRKLALSVELRVKEREISVLKSHQEYEQQVFLNAFAKYQSNNPFRRVLNENVPFVLLLQVINSLDADRDSNGAGISRLELPLVIYWKDGNAEKLVSRIRKLRKEFGYSPSWEIITDICRNEIMDGKDIIRDEKSIMVDYPDEFIRKMRLTGLISLRGGGRFIDINRNEQEKVNYVLDAYSSYRKFDSEKEYFKYISALDDNLVSLTPRPVRPEEKSKYLEKWVGFYPWEKVKFELTMLAKKHMTEDALLKYLPFPVRLEFLVALAIKSKFPDVRVIPNYPVDDEGVPTACAGGIGDTGDIECWEEMNGILVEVTMLEGRTQTVAEIWPIARHLEEFSRNTENSMCYFIAPSIFSDSLRQISYVKDNENLFICPKTIEEFVSYLEKAPVLYMRQ